MPFKSDEQRRKVFAVLAGGNKKTRTLRPKIKAGKEADSLFDDERQSAAQLANIEWSVEALKKKYGHRFRFHTDVNRLLGTTHIVISKKTGASRRLDTLDSSSNYMKAFDAWVKRNAKWLRGEGI